MKTKVDKKNISKQMFDIKPTKRAGVLDTQKIFSIGKILDAKKIEEEKKARQKRFLLDLGGYNAAKKEDDLSAKKPIEDVYKTEKDILDAEAERFKYFYNNLNEEPPQETLKKGTGGIIKEETENEEITNITNICNSPIIIEDPIIVKEADSKKDFLDFKKFRKEIKEGFVKINGTATEAVSPLFRHWKRSLAVFTIMCCIITSSVGAFAFYHKEARKTSTIKDLGVQGFYSIMDAKSNIENQNFKTACSNFQKAAAIFKKAENQISPAENLFAKIPDLFGNSLPSSGIHLIKTGKHISNAGLKISQAFLPLFEKNGFILDTKILDALLSADKLVGEALNEIKAANKEAKQIDENALSKNAREYGKQLKDTLPKIQNILGKSAQYLSNTLELIGNNNPKKYLLIFQNNSELRATGGFIGSFAVIDVYKGNITNIKVDGIYNPAGQLLEKVVPPLPFKKVTDKWNIFDANYFANFPTSAKKVAWFYEKTGGPTVDGVIAFTPKVLEDLLQILGHVKLNQYGITIEPQNFVDAVQVETEQNFDKAANQPKKIIGDLAQILIKKILSSNQRDWESLLQIFKDNLNKKNILIYFSDIRDQRMIEEERWSGEVLPSRQDYLQIVHTNINGYKTDRKIQEKINHKISIDNNGNITDTVKITKKHNGGNSQYDWYNRQNGDFLRAYVPLGSKFISAKGFSTEKNYSKTKDFSDFTKDPDVENIENNMQRNDKSGVFIFEESGKTVFGGWMYTNPGEISSVELTYRLPFKILKNETNYDVLYQKQSGHPGVLLTTELSNSGKLVDKKIINLLKDEEVRIEL